MAAAGRLTPPELRRYADPSTELPVVRLTDPAFASGMTAPHLRQFGRRSDTLLYWSDRGGSRQAYLLDLKSGGSRQLTDAAELDVSSLSLTNDERSFNWFDGPSLNEASLSLLRPREIYRIPEGSTRTGFSVAADGSMLFAERSGDGARLMRATRMHTAPVLQVTKPVDWVMARPRRASALYRSAEQLWLVNNDGSGNRQIRTEPGIIGEVLWMPSGKTFVYLHIPGDAKQLIALRENSPEENTDKQLARTSQYGAFGANADSSVFAGASRGKAQAYVLILLRVTRRELALCEHRASDPRMVSPVFSPDSQSVFYVSDRDGKSALYRVHVEKFVEQTGDEPS